MLSSSFSLVIKLTVWNKRLTSCGSTFMVGGVTGKFACFFKDCVKKIHLVMIKQTSMGLFHKAVTNKCLHNTFHFVCSKSLFHCVLISLVSMSKAMCLYSRLVGSILGRYLMCRKATDVCPRTFAGEYP